MRLADNISCLLPSLGPLLFTKYFNLHHYLNFSIILSMDRDYYIRVLDREAKVLRESLI